MATKDKKEKIVDDEENVKFEHDPEKDKEKKD